MTALLAARATVDQAMNDGFTPLLVAAQRGHHEVVTALIAARARVDLAKNDGRAAARRGARGTTRSWRR